MAGPTRIRDRRVRVADKLDDSKSPAQIQLAIPSSITEEDLQVFFLSRLREIVFGSPSSNHWYDTVPTYARPDAMGVLLSKILLNIYPLDQKLLNVNRTFYEASVTVSDTLITITSVGDLPHANATNATGVPCFDRAPYVGDFTSCFVGILVTATGGEILVLAGAHAGEKVFGVTYEGSSTSPDSVEVHFYSVPMGGDPTVGSTAYTWEAGQPTTINLVYGYGERGDLLDLNCLRSTPAPSSSSSSGGMDQLTGDVLAGPGSGLQEATVVGLQTTPVQGPAMGVGDVPIFDGSMYEIRPLTMDDIQPAWTITGFGVNVASYVLMGDTVANPHFTASYVSAPTSASLLDNHGSPALDVSLTPNNFTYPHSYTESAYGASVEWVLTAEQGVKVKTAGASVTWTNVAYYGVGPQGSSSAVFVQSLTSFLTTGRQTSFLVNAGPGDCIFYAFRNPYGIPTFWVGGFAGGFSLVNGSLPVPNTKGVVENYSVWSSNQPNLGPTTVTVT
jgi:hypothetical protein